MTKKCIVISILCSMCLSSFSATLEEQAKAKMTELQSLMTTAQAKKFDIKREELAMWVANEFLKFANWDEANVTINEKLFDGYAYFRPNKTQIALDLADNERKHVIQILNTAISELSAVLEGEITRRPAVVPDWYNIQQGNDELLSQGKPIFLYDYFSKSFGIADNDSAVYNDYLGNIDKTKNVNNRLVDENFNPEKQAIEKIKTKKYDRVGYTLFWNKPLATWQKNIPEVSKGRAYYFDYDIDNPTMQKAMEAVAGNVAKNLKGKKVIDLGYCLANEPHWYSEKDFWTQQYGEMNDISSHTLGNFRNWLKKKYHNDLTLINKSWNEEIKNFDSIKWNIPVDKSYHGTAQWYDWCRFNMDRVNDFFQMLNDAIIAEDPNAKTHIKVMSATFMGDRHSGIDLEALTDMCGMIGDDAAAFRKNNRLSTPAPWEEKYAYEWKKLAMMYDFMESVSPQKIHINSESHFVSKDFFRDLELQPQYIRNVYWLATLLGMDANLTWFWPRQPSGRPEERFFGTSYTETSYPGSCATQPLVVNEHAKVMMDLNSYSEEILKLRREKKKIRIFYSETSNIHNNNQLKIDTYELYEKLFFEGYPIGFATENIIKKQDHKLWNVIVIYKTQYVTNNEVQALQSYLNQGGTIIIDNGCSLIMNEYGKTQKVQLNENKGKLVQLGANATATDMANSALACIKDSHKITVKEKNIINSKTCLWRISENKDGSFLLNLLNLGKNEAQLEIISKDKTNNYKTIDLLTGKEINNVFQMPSEAVLLLKMIPN